MAPVTTCGSVTANGSVLADLFDLLHQSKPPEERQWLREEYLGDSRYWVFQR